MATCVSAFFSVTPTHTILAFVSADKLSLSKSPQPVLVGCRKPNASSQLLTGPLITLPPKAKSELVKWSENQLAVFPRHNVDIPTLVGLLCDIEDAEDVLECIESSFGKSQRVSKFSKAFVEKRANLMGATA
uniref:GYF domain-containing protein n=1 Tax=Mesocestoides corti TaxID=53468 RepID=A0A5K3F602_MESCO